MDERMPRHACFLHLVTTVSVLSRALARHAIQHCSAAHFVFDNTLPRGANRLLILASLPIRARAFQSNRWYCPKIVLPALPGEMGCQSPCLIMSYYPLCPQTGERATPVSMWSWSIHNHFPVTAMALSGDNPAPRTSHFRKKEFGTPLFWPRKAGGGGGWAVAKWRLDSFKQSLPWDALLHFHYAWVHYISLQCAVVRKVTVARPGKYLLTIRLTNSEWQGSSYS